VLRIRGSYWTRITVMLVIFLWLVIFPLVSLPLADEAIWIRQSGYQTFRQGTAGDSGANLYVSYKGRIQTINRWDLNRDGEIDLLFTQDHDNVYTPDSLIYWGGQGGYQSLLPDLWQLRAPFSLLGSLQRAGSRITRLPSVGGGRSQIADLNNDGCPDIVFCNFMHNYRPDQPAYIYWGSAAGFQPTARTELPAYLAGGVAVGDLNGDGLLEVVLANHGDEVGELRGFRLHLESYIYWGNLNGYDVSRRTSLPTISAADVAIGDYNGDGSPDLAFVNLNSQEQSAYIYWGDGKGNYSEQRRQVLRRSDLHLPDIQDGQHSLVSGMKTLKSADLNRDHVADLVIGGTEKAVVYYGTPNGLNLQHSVELPASNCQGIEAADLNQDGLVDLILANEGKWTEQSPPSTIFWATAQGYRSDRRTDLPTLAATTVTASDLNGDHFPDLLFGNSHDLERSDVPSYIYWGGPKGYAGYRRSDLLGFGVAGSGVADLDNDGKLDILLVSHLSGRTGVLPSIIFWGNSEQYYSSASATLLDPGGEMEDSVADLDDDGYPDIVFMQTGRAFVWWGSPDGYKKDNRSKLPVDSPLSNSIADLNSDGFLDILIGVSSPDRAERRARAVIVWGNGSRFRQARTTELKLSGPAIESSAIADLNRDGYLDLIFPLGLSDHSEIWWGGSQGYKSDNTSRLQTNGSPHVAVADLDQDEWLDLIFTSGHSLSKQSANTQTLIYWGGPKGFSPDSRTGFEGFTSLDATVADFNRDGHLDIAMTNYKSDTTRDLPAFIYWGGERRNFSEKHRTLLDAFSSSAIDALDLNRDGWPDLVLSNHQIRFDHAAGTYIYWGGPEGFSRRHRSHIPTVGVHLDAMVDAGNIYTRRYEWDYFSAPLEAPQNARFARMHWKAETELETSLKFQVRSASTREGLEKAIWSGPRGAGTFYLTSGSRLTEGLREHRWMQYRVLLTSPNGGNSPILTEVALECVR
jgi:hypothetical protein